MRRSVVFGVTLKLLVINISSSSPAINTTAYYQRCVITCETLAVVHWRPHLQHLPVVALTQAVKPDIGSESPFCRKLNSHSSVENLAAPLQIYKPIFAAKSKCREPTQPGKLNSNVQTRKAKVKQVQNPLAAATFNMRKRLQQSTTLSPLCRRLCRQLHRRLLQTVRKQSTTKDRNQ